MTHIEKMRLAGMQMGVIKDNAIAKGIAQSGGQGRVGCLVCGSTVTYTVNGETGQIEAACEAGGCVRCATGGADWRKT